MFVSVCVCIYKMCVPCSVTNHDFRTLIAFSESNRNTVVHFHFIVSLVAQGIVLALESSFLLDFLGFVSSHKTWSELK